MRIADVLNLADWPETEGCLRRHYCNDAGNPSDRDEFVLAHKYVYHQLRGLQPSPEGTVLTIDFDDDDGIEEFHVRGIEPGSGDFLAIEFARWERWLGMEIAPSTLRQFSPPEIVAHCLHEMSFVGYDQDEIAEVAAEVERRAETVRRLDGPDDGGENR